MYIVTRLISGVHFHITGPKLTFKTYNFRHCDTSMSPKTADYFPSGGVIETLLGNCKVLCYTNMNVICFGYQPIKFLYFQTIWSFPLTNVKWHSVTWPYTITTPYWSDFVPNSTFNRNLSGFHRTFATGVACRQRTLTPPDTWSRLFGTCICSTCWDQSFSELVVI